MARGLPLRGSTSKSVTTMSSAVIDSYGVDAGVIAIRSRPSSSPSRMLMFPAVPVTRPMSAIVRAASAIACLWLFHLMCMRICTDSLYGVEEIA